MKEVRERVVEWKGLVDYFKFGGKCLKVGIYFYCKKRIIELENEIEELKIVLKE